MKFLLLGPFSVVDGDRTVAVGRGNERALIALLALHANTVVSTDRIIDAMWGDRPPASARDMVRLYISRARSRVGDRLVTESTGYRLRTENGEVDVAELEQLRRSGTEALAAGDVAAAARYLSDGIGLVRGEPLAEFAEFPFAQDETPRLDELRLGTTEEYYDALLTAGEAAELVPALEQLVEENPYRERLRGQLMLALYRAGRQTDALARYQEGRRLLADEVGIEPSPRLRELERAILQHDDDLMPVARRTGEGTQSPEVPPPLHQRRPRRRWIAPALLGLLVLGAGGAALVLTQTGGTAGLSSLPRNSVGVVDAPSGTIARAIQLPGDPVDLTVSAGRVWVAMGEPHRIGEIEPGSTTLANTFPLPAVPRRIGPGTGGVWINDSYYGTIRRLDAAGGNLGRPEPIFGPAPARISFAARPGTLWVAADTAGQAANVDPRTGRVIRRVTGLHAPIAVAAGLGAVWLAAANRAEVERARGSEVHAVPIGAAPAAVTTGGGAVWAVSPINGTLTRIDPRPLEVRKVFPIAGYPTSVAYGGGFVWVGLAHGNGVVRVNPRTNTVETIHVRRPVDALAFFEGRLWVAVS